MRVLTWVGIIGCAVVGIIGFAASYTTLEEAARAWGFGRLAPAFPIGIDASILAFIAMDLVMIHRGRPWPVLRVVGHGMVAVTVLLNASAHGGLTLSSRSLSHAVMPVLFVVGTEAARRMAVHAANLAAGHDSIPFARWFLALIPTFKLWRRMKLWGMHSYSAAVRVDQDRESYRAYLEWKQAVETGKDRAAQTIADRMPFRMAAYGLSTEEALLVLESEEHAAAERERAAADRKKSAALAEREAAAERTRRAAAATVTELHAGHTIERERIALGADLGAAEATAAAQTEAARTAAAIEARALETAATAAARRQAAEDDRAAADAERAAADARAAAVDVERDAVDAERAAADARALAADIDRRAAAAELAAAEDRERAADADRRAADARRAAVDAEAAALDAEALMKISPSERAARYVARIVLREYEGDAERMSVESVAEALGVAHGTASKRRQEAADLIAGGYRG